jgi:hypothetical protein
METVVITGICTLVVSAITGIVTHLLGKKKFVAETASVEQNNLKTQMETYEAFITNMSNRTNEILLASHEREKAFKEKEIYFLEQQKIFDNVNEEHKKKMAQIKKIVTKILLKTCIIPGCGNRTLMNTDEFEEIERMFEE